MDSWKFTLAVTAAEAVRAAMAHDVYTGGDVVIRYSGSDPNDL